MITFVGESHGNTGVATTASVGNPANSIVQDLAVASIVIVSASDTVSTLSGWTVFPGMPLTDGSLTQYWFYKLLQPGEPTAWSFTISSSVTWVSETAVYRGVDQNVPLDASQATTFASTSTPSVAGVTVGRHGNMLVLIAGADTSWGTSHVPPAGMTARVQASDGDERIDDMLVSAGATGSISWSEASASAGRAVVFSLNTPQLAGLTPFNGRTRPAPFRPGLAR